MKQWNTEMFNPFREEKVKTFKMQKKAKATTSYYVQRSSVTE